MIRFDLECLAEDFFGGADYLEGSVLVFFLSPGFLCFALLCSALLCLLVSVSACPQYSLSSKSRSIRSDPVRGLRAIATYLCLLASG